MNNIPIPSSENLIKSQKLLKIIKEQIIKNKYIKFSKYMNLALYNKNYGYYCNNNIKIGSQGDFITSPSITNIFGKTISNQIQQILQYTQKNVYEIGAGNGTLAIDILTCLPNIQNYYIIEISQYLQNKQYQNIKNKIPNLIYKVKFLDKITNNIEGVLIANELLDAIACDLVYINNEKIYSLDVKLNETSQNLEFTKNNYLNDYELNEINKYIPQKLHNYTTEIHIQQKKFVKNIIDNLYKGIAIFIDYGFPAYEYYHPQRNMGTLIGHYKHLIINDPFIYPGLVDLTSHVNFTAIADTIIENNASLLGYTTQDNFLLNLNILNILQNDYDINSNEYLKQSNACKILLNPSEMGKLFKVIAFGKNIDINLLGFQSNDLSHKL